MLNQNSIAIFVPSRFLKLKLHLNHFIKHILEANNTSLASIAMPYLRIYFRKKKYQTSLELNIVMIIRDLLVLRDLD